MDPGHRQDRLDSRRDKPHIVVEQSHLEPSGGDARRRQASSISSPWHWVLAQAGHQQQIARPGTRIRHGAAGQDGGAGLEALLCRQHLRQKLLAAEAVCRVRAVQCSSSATACKRKGA
jgi:hypothetical protein